MRCVSLANFQGDVCFSLSVNVRLSELFVIFTRISVEERGLKLLAPSGQINKIEFSNGDES